MLSERLSDDDLAKIKLRAEKATPGPWIHASEGIIETKNPHRRIVAMTGRSLALKWERSRRSTAASCHSFLNPANSYRRKCPKSVSCLPKVAFYLYLVEVAYCFLPKTIQPRRDCERREGGVPCCTGVIGAWGAPFWQRDWPSDGCLVGADGCSRISTRS